MDIISTIADSQYYTLHSHTEFCDGHAPMQEFAQEAVKQGFVHYGFSPHSPIPFASSCNMSEESVPLYLKEVERISQEFPQVRFYKGMEVDYINKDWGPACDFFKSLPLDFTIGSVHFIPNQDGEYVDIDGRYESFKTKMQDKFHNDIRYVVETFYLHSQQMITLGGFDILGHFDKIKHNGSLYHPGLEDEDWYNALVNDLIDSIISSKVVVEINTKAWRQHQQLFPSQRYWKRLLNAKVPIVVNSDAHWPKLINDGRMPVIQALNYLKNKL